MVLLGEDAIEDAVRFAFTELGTVLECSGAVALAAALSGKVETGQDTVIVLSGSNIDDAELDRILCHKPRASS